MTAPSIDTRTWMLAALDEAGERINTLQSADATVLETSWTTDGVTVTAKRHGDGCTLCITFSDQRPPIGPMTFPFGWTQAT